MSGFRILVVEDHEDTLEAVVGYLEQLGHVVRAARTKAEALAALREDLPDLLLSDIGLPDGTGWALLRESCLPESVFTVALSGYGTAADLEESRRVGFRHHLVKPTDPDDLDEVLAEAVEERRSR